MKKDCRKYKKWKAEKEKEKVNQAVNENKNIHICFGVKSGNCSGQTWYIDSTMSNDKNFFEILNTCTNESITLANGDSAEVQGIGDGYLTCKDNKGKQNAIMVKKVLYVPTLEENLLSVRKLAEKGLQVKFTENICNIMKDDITVTTADLSGNLYRLRFDNKALMIIKKHRKDCQHLWHRKLGHRDPKAVKQMKTKDLVTGLEITDCGIRSVCETCIKDKMTRQSFPKKSYSITGESLDLIHTNVCRSMQTITPGERSVIYLLSLTTTASIR